MQFLIIPEKMPKVNNVYLILLYITNFWINIRAISLIYLLYSCRNQPTLSFSMNTAYMVFTQAQNSSYL
jgi:hypothetical protein